MIHRSSLLAATCCHVPLSVNWDSCAFFAHDSSVVVVEIVVVVVVVVADAASAVLSGRRSLQFFCEKANLAL